MVRTLKGLVVAIPAAVTATGSAVARLIAVEQGDLVLGAATAAQLKSVGASIQRDEIAYTAQVDLERPKSVDEFFEIAIGQFGRIDAIILETAKGKTRSSPTEKSIALGVRRLLYCLDSALRYCVGDLHVINISPLADRYAIPVATTFLGGKLATSKSTVSSAPSLRMSVISPAEGVGSDNGTLARTVLHVLRESRNPDVTETVLWRRPQQPERRSRLAPTRSKIMVPL
jgi:NADP-dependent 3-hydroxy acid dehydrogenase YdfG